VARKKLETPPMDAIEKDFMEALQRLRDGAPREKALRELKARGRLKINISTVAQEARRSRTLIALESCKYAKVREHVRLAMEGRTTDPHTSNELIDKLRGDVAELRAELKKAEAETAAHFLARSRVEQEHQRLQARYDRLARKAVDGSRSDDKVVHLHPGG